MSKINLLPWRDELRQKQQKAFVNALVFSVLVTCLIFGGVYQYLDGRKTYQGRRNGFLEKKIAEVDKKIEEIKKIQAKKDRLTTKIEIIEGLQASRTEIVHVFDELRKIIPEGIYLTELIQLGHKLTFKGRSTANSEVSALMDALVDSEWLNLDGSGLKKIDGRERSEKEKNSQFIILAKQIRAEDKKQAEDELDAMETK